MGNKNVNEITFITGGCRSGKSTYALQLAERLPAEKSIFIATCAPQDEEMKQRVAKHQRQRSRNWITIEEPLRLPEAILQNSRREEVILIDCLTLWVSNLLMETDDAKQLEQTISKLIHSLEKAKGPVVLVSNEVGTGIVPENRLARQYRDIIGLVNQAVAQTAGKVIWMVAGIPATIKG